MVTPRPTHPAKFSEPILDRLAVLLAAEEKITRARRAASVTRQSELFVLDPFAGVGRIHRLARPGKIVTLGLELEPEWAACHSDTVCTDALAWMRADVARHVFDVVATSPTYGNRFADHHNAQDGSRRHSYTHDLGRPLTDGTSATLPWGPRYWDFHAEAYRLIYEVLRPGGLFLLNVSNFPRKRAMVHAVDWHNGAAYGAGFVQDQRPARIVTKRLRGVGVTADQAAADPDRVATDQRADHEVILRLRKPIASERS